MPALSKEARRYKIRVTNRLGKRLWELGKQLAAEESMDDISAQHIEFALRQLMGDNPSLMQCLLGEGDQHGQRRAG